VCDPKGSIGGGDGGVEKPISPTTNTRRRVFSERFIDVLQRGSSERDCILPGT
jgi:hypothetical protein